MPYNGDGFYYEEAYHGKDADRRFYSETQDMRRTISRLDSILSNRRCGSRRAQLTDYRNALLADLHDHELCGSRYDARLAAAREDMTGQDEDAFYGDY